MKILFLKISPIESDKDEGKVKEEYNVFCVKIIFS